MALDHDVDLAFLLVASQALIDSVSAVATRDSLLLGFGAEQVASPAARNALLGRALRHLLN